MSVPKFVVITSSAAESGLVLNYLHQTTGLRVERVYHDTMTEVRQRNVAPVVSIRQRLRWHAGLMLKLPRMYRWLALERLTGLTHLEALRAIERVDRGLLAHLCPESVDPERAPMDRLLVSLEEVAERQGFPIVPTPNINRADAVASLRESGADVIIGLGTRILSPAVLESSSQGVLNGHSAILPAYRGSAAEFWQLVSDERETGVTIHWMAPKVDSGAICAIRRWPIPPGADHFSLRLRSLFYRLPLWSRVIGDLLKGVEHREDQGPSPTRTFKRPTQADMFKYYCQGVNPLDGA